MGGGEGGEERWGLEGHNSLKGIFCLLQYTPATDFEREKVPCPGCVHVFERALK